MFSVNFMICSRTPFIQNTSCRLFFKILWQCLQIHFKCLRFQLLILFQSTPYLMWQCSWIYLWYLPAKKVDDVVGWCSGSWWCSGTVAHYFFLSLELHLGLTRKRPISYRNQSIDLQSKSMDWFLYDIGLRHERVKGFDDNQIMFQGFWINLWMTASSYYILSQSTHS